MDLNEFYRQLDELLELPAGSVNGETVLKAVQAWDSVAVISFIAMVDTNYGLTVPAKHIAGCVTARDLADLVALQGSRAAAVE